MIPLGPLAPGRRTHQPNGQRLQARRSRRARCLGRLTEPLGSSASAFGKLVGGAFVVATPEVRPIEAVCGLWFLRGRGPWGAGLLVVSRGLKAMHIDRGWGRARCLEPKCGHGATLRYPCMLRSPAACVRVGNICCVGVSLVVFRIGLFALGVGAAANEPIMLAWCVIGFGIVHRLHVALMASSVHGRHACCRWVSRIRHV